MGIKIKPKGLNDRKLKMNIRPKGEVAPVEEEAPVLEEETPVLEEEVAAEPEMGIDNSESTL